MMKLKIYESWKSNIGILIILMIFVIFITYRMISLPYVLPDTIIGLIAELLSIILIIYFLERKYSIIKCERYEIIDDEKYK